MSEIAPNPWSLADQLVLLYDGAGISAWMDQAAQSAITSAAIARGLADAALSR